jgi:hypothetical protein
MLSHNCISAYLQSQFFFHHPQLLKKVLLHNCISAFPDVIAEVRTEKITKNIRFHCA